LREAHDLLIALHRGGLLCRSGCDEGKDCAGYKSGYNLKTRRPSRRGGAHESSPLHGGYADNDICVEAAGTNYIGHWSSVASKGKTGAALEACLVMVGEKSRLHSSAGIPVPRGANEQDLIYIV
jgi:hypothetical protein